MNNQKLRLDDISLIIVNYNASHEIMALLGSIEQAGYTDLEIIVVDNGSPSDQINDIAERYPNVICQTSKTNLGFAGGNNLGYQYATKELLFFVNPDTRIQSNFFEPILDYFNTHTKIGLLSPRIMYEEGKDIVQYAGTSAMHPITLRTKTAGKGESMCDQFKNISTTFFGHGAAMFVPRHVIELVGLMDESYFLYYEELDWCQRIRNHGFDIIYFGNSEIIHLESISVGKESPLKIYYMSRNRLHFAKKHFSSFYICLNFLYALLVLLPKAIVTYFKDPKLLKAWLQGFVWHLNPYRKE